STADIGAFGGSGADTTTSWVDADGDDHWAMWDCDDTDDAVNPDADEVCDGVDNDCDGEIDEGAIDALTWFRDADSDGYGDAGTTVEACTAPSGYVADDKDCDDTRSTVNPGAAEYCNGRDDDCDGATDEPGAVDGTRYYPDVDGDSYGDQDHAGTRYCSDPAGGLTTDHSDCDDANTTIAPAADARSD